MSYVVVLEEAVQDREAAAFIRLQFSPLNAKKLQLLSSKDNCVSTKTYHHLNKIECADRLVADVRGHIQNATPNRLKDMVEAVFVGLSPDDPDFKDYKVLQQTIPEKYYGAQDPQKAYLDAMHYK